NKKVGGDSLERRLKRTQTTWDELVELDGELRRWPANGEVVEQVVLEAKYSGYIDRQADQVERFQRMETKRIPEEFDFAAVPQLRAEAKEKLSRIRPASIGQASRVSGITPADLAVLLFYLG